MSNRSLIEYALLGLMVTIIVVAAIVGFLTLTQRKPAEVPEFWGTPYEPLYELLTSASKPHDILVNWYGNLDNWDFWLPLSGEAWAEVRWSLISFSVVPEYITPTDPVVLKVATELSPKRGSKLELAIAAFEYTAGFKPPPGRYHEWKKPAEVIQTGVGDCKGLSSVLVSLLLSEPFGFDSDEVWQVNAFLHSYVIIKVENVWLPLDPARADDFWYLARNQRELNDLDLYLPREVFNDRSYGSWTLVKHAVELEKLKQIR